MSSSSGDFVPMKSLIPCPGALPLDPTGASSRTILWARSTTLAQNLPSYIIPSRSLRSSSTTISAPLRKTLTVARPTRGPERTPKSIFLVFCIEVIWWWFWSSRSSQMTIWHYFFENIHSDMFTTWPPRLTQSDPSEQKYANICYICNMNWRRHARKMIFYLFPTFFG